MRFVTRALPLCFVCSSACTNFVGRPHDASSESGSDATTDAAPIADAPDVASTTLVTVTGLVLGLDDLPIDGATVGALQLPGTTATTTADGNFEIQLPAETPLSLFAEAPRHVRTVEQSLILHGNAYGRVIPIATTAQFNLTIQGSGNAPAGTAAMIVCVEAGDQCPLAGSTIGTTPASGRVVYSAPNRLPDPTATAVQPYAPGAYVTGVSGTVTPWIMPAHCGAAPFPYEESTAVTLLGTIETMPGVFYDTKLFVR